MPHRKQNSPESKSAHRKSNLTRTFIAIAAGLLVINGISAISKALSHENNQPSSSQIRTDWDKFMMETCGNKILTQLDGITIVPESTDGKGVLAHLIECKNTEGKTIVSMPDVVVIGDQNKAGIVASLKKDPWNEIARMDIVKSSINGQFTNTQRGTNLADKESIATFMASTYITTQTPDLCANIPDQTQCALAIGSYGDGLAALVNEVRHPGFLTTGVYETTAQIVSPYDDKCMVARQVEAVVIQTGSTRPFPAGFLPSVALGCKPR